MIIFALIWLLIGIVAFVLFVIDSYSLYKKHKIVAYNKTKLIVISIALLLLGPFILGKKFLRFTIKLLLG